MENAARRVNFLLQVGYERNEMDYQDAWQALISAKGWDMGPLGLVHSVRVWSNCP